MSKTTQVPSFFFLRPLAFLFTDSCDDEMDAFEIPSHIERRIQPADNEINEKFEIFVYDTPLPADSGDRRIRETGQPCV